MTRKRYLRVVVPIMALLGSLLALTRMQTGLRCTVSPSIPPGCYWVTDVEPVRGDYVGACLSEDLAVFAHERGYLRTGSACPGGTAMLLKVLVAQAGDDVVIGPDGVVVNGQLLPRSKPHLVDAHGYALPSPPAGRRQLSGGEVLLMSQNHPGGFDGRYFGITSRAAVIGRAKQLVTWENI